MHSIWPRGRHSTQFEIKQYIFSTVYPRSLSIFIIFLLNKNGKDFCIRLPAAVCIFLFLYVWIFFYRFLFVWLFMFCIVYILYFQEVFSIFMCQIAIWKRTRLYGPLLCLSVMFALPYAIAWITLTSSYGTKALVFTLYVKLKLLNNWNIDVNFLTSISHNLISRTNLALKMANLSAKFVQNLSK